MFHPILMCVLVVLCAVGVVVTVMYPGPVYAACVVLGLLSWALQESLCKRMGIPTYVDTFRKVAGFSYTYFMLASIVLCGLFAIIGFKYPNRGGLILVVYIITQALFSVWGAWRISRLTQNQNQ